MAQATLVTLTFVNNHMFATIKNGNAYRFNTEIPADKHSSMRTRIEAKGKLALKHWTKCADAKGYKPLCHPVHACNIAAAESQADRFLGQFKARVNKAVAAGNIKQLTALGQAKAAKLIRTPDPRIAAFVSTELQYARNAYIAMTAAA